MTRQLPVTDSQGADREMILNLQRETFDYFIGAVSPQTRLTLDSTQPGSPVSIAAVGLGMSAYVVAAERGIVSREEAAGNILSTLRFFNAAPQGPESDATGYKGFFYHFLDPETGRRVWQSELSTIDTAIFIAGGLSAGQYFRRDTDGESEIRTLAEELYRRIDWQWAQNGGDTFAHGWKPESGFLPYRWDSGLSEAHVLYLLALGSPTFPIEARGYESWTATFEVKTLYGIEYIYAGPLFIHQLSQLWLDFRGIRDALTRKLGFDYFENSRRATYIQRAYAIENPRRFSHYGEHCWGITASDGPGPCEIEIEGMKRIFYGYIARGAPDDLDDGTISPWAVVTSLPFAPEITLRSIRHAIERLKLKNHKKVSGFDASFNPTFPSRDSNPNGWVSPWRLGINQGPIVMMIENYESRLLWKLMGKCPYIIDGMERAGFLKPD